MAVDGAVENTDFLHHTALDDEGVVKIWWTPRDDNVLFKVQVNVEADTPPPDYIALGTSLNGGMLGADIWMTVFDKDNNPQLFDMHGIGNQSPLLDQQQGLKLISSRRHNGLLESTFEKHDSCHPNDIDLSTKASINLIWAYGQVGNKVSSPNYHGSNRGSKRVNLHQPEIEKFPDNFDTFIDIKKKSVQIPATDTFYHCSIHKLPDFERKAHYIGFKPIIEEANIQIVHHIVMYECSVPNDRLSVFQQHADSELHHQCYHPNMPSDWKHCRNVAVVWAVGGSGEIVPQNVGVPLGSKHGYSDFFMLEVHYDNPQLRTDVVDSSGLRVFYTHQLRPVEGGTLTVGNEVLPVHAIPAGSDRFLTTSLCSSQCTRSLPKDGITIYSLLLHTHLAGRQIRLQHLKADGSRLAVIADNPSYDFNYQQTWTLAQPVKILPGDQLLLECAYNTSQRQSTTFGGLSTYNEMCLAFLNYYPRVKLIHCSSSTDMGILLEDLGSLQLISGDKTIPVSEHELVGNEIQNIIDSFREPKTNSNESQPKSREELKKLYQRLKEIPNEQHTAYLFLNSLRVVSSTNSSLTLFELLKSGKWSDQKLSRYFRPRCQTYGNGFERLNLTMIPDRTFNRVNHNEDC